MNRTLKHAQRVADAVAQLLEDATPESQPTEDLVNLARFAHESLRAAEMLKQDRVDEAQTSVGSSFRGRRVG